MSATNEYIDKIKSVLQSKKNAYVYKEHSPEFAYYFTFNQLYGDKIDESVQRFERDNVGFKDSVIWNMLFDFQKEDVEHCTLNIAH